MKYYIIAGEASGDLHGSNLIKALINKDANAEVRAWGGDKMKAAGATLVKHYRDLAFMGFVEVVKHLGTILNNIAFCKKDILQFKPDVLVLIDYPGFNLRIAKWAKSQGIKVCYYISPQIWAWKENRVKTIKKCVDKMLVILPFEKEFYKKHQYEALFVGHPLTEVIRQEIAKPLTPISIKPIIAVLPGSRSQEINTKLPIMLSVVKQFPQYQFVVAQAPGQEESVYQNIIQEENVLLVKNDTYNILRQAKAALVTSGTATLETALLSVPQVVCYKGNSISYRIAKNLIKVKYISLVNLILDKLSVVELIQHDLNHEMLLKELTLILNNEERKAQIQKDYALLWKLLGELNASENAAQEIYTLATS